MNTPSGSDPASSSGEQYSLHISVNLAAMIGKVQRALQHAIDLLAFGIRAAESVTADEALRLPTLFGFSPAENEALSTDVARERFLTWLVSAHLRDCVEALHLYLDEVRVVCAMYTLASKGQVRVDEWERETGAKSKRFHRLGLPQKLEHLSQEYGVVLSDSASEMLLSINAARNCLVHRAGVVSSLDATVEGALLIKFLAQEIAIQTPEGTQVVIDRLPFEAGEGSQVIFRNAKQELRFDIGQQVQFSAESFASICWTLLAICADINREVESYGRRLGLDFPDAAQSGG